MVQWHCHRYRKENMIELLINVLWNVHSENRVGFFCGCPERSDFLLNLTHSLFYLLFLLLQKFVAFLGGT
jgi:hypothetical protein